jgi:hypothetical protein
MQAKAQTELFKERKPSAYYQGLSVESKGKDHGFQGSWTLIPTGNSDRALIARAYLPMQAFILICSIIGFVAEFVLWYI